MNPSGADTVVTRIAMAALAVAALSAAAPAQAAPSREALLQFSYGTDAPQCHFRVDNGVGVEFNGVFANEDNQVAFYELGVFSVPTSRRFSHATLVTVSIGGTSRPAKVVKTVRGRVWFATDPVLLKQLMGANPKVDAVVISGLTTPDALATVPMPRNRRAALAALARGEQCYEDALNVN